MTTNHVGLEIGPILRACLRPEGSPRIVFAAIVVKRGNGTDSYPKMELVPECCNVYYGLDLLPHRVEIVARGTGESNQGPFRFSWSDDDDVDPDQPACLGMSLVELVMS